jgi:hypothetical protein
MLRHEIQCDEPPTRYSYGLDYRFASSVTMIHRRDTLHASKIMQDPGAGEPEDQVPVGQRGHPGDRGD